MARQSTKVPASSGALFPLRVFWRPQVVAEFLFGVSPLIGVIWWGWDVYLVLMAHLLAIGISAAWLALRMASLSAGAIGYFKGDRIPEAGRATRWLLAGFIVFVFGLPLLLLIGMLTEQHGGAWYNKAIHSPADFWRVVVVSSGLWMQLAAVTICVIRRAILTP